MMVPQDFSQNLIDLRAKLDAFHVDFSRGEDVDFSVIYQDVHTFISQAASVKLTTKEKTLLKELSDRLTSIFAEMEQELQETREQLSQSAIHQKGLKAYVRHQYDGGNNGSSGLD